MEMDVNIYHLELMFNLKNISLAVENDEKDHTDRGLIFKKKR